MSPLPPLCLAMSSSHAGVIVPRYLIWLTLLGESKLTRLKFTPIYVRFLEGRNKRLWQILEATIYNLLSD